MLERATACIAKAGARDSLQCARQTRRASRRLLHPAFRTHGAGDLDTPAPSTRSLLSCGDTEPVVAGTTRSNTAVPTTDTAFLDFLYPPQALAYLRRASRQHVQPRTRRDARRPTDGFVQASRSYSSTSTPGSANYKPFGQEQSALNDAEGVDEPRHAEDDDFFRHDLMGDVEAEQDQSTSHARGPGLPDVESTNLKDFAREFLVRKAGESSRAPSADFRGEEDGDNEHAHSPGDLAEEDISRLDGGAATSLYGDIQESAVEPADRLQRLRQMLAGKAYGIPTQHIRQAWRLYLSLSGHDKQDIRLKEKLLLWLNSHENELADAYIIALFWSIPLQARQLTTYSTVTKSFIRQQAWNLLFNMHREALVNIPNGQELSLQLFADAMKSSHWPGAVRVMRDQENGFPIAERQHRMQLFWVKLHEIPDLLAWVPPLLRGPKNLYFSKFYNQNSRREFKQLASRLAKEAVQQATDELLIKKLSAERSQKLFSLLNLIVQLDHEVHTFIQGLLTRLIPSLGQLYLSRRGPDLEGLQRDAHEVISFLYWYYRQSKVASLHPDLLDIWLKHLTQRMRTTDVERRSERNVTASMVIEDWQKWHGQIGVEAVHNLISYSAHTGSVDALRRWTAYLERRYPAYSEQRKAFWPQIYVHARMANVSAARKAFQDVSRSARAHGDRLDLKCWQVLLHAYQSADDLEGALDAFKELVQTTKLTPDRTAFNPLLNMLSRRGDVDGIEDLMRQSDVFTQEKRETRSALMHIMALTSIDDVPRAELVLAETLGKVRNGEVIGSMTECFNTLLAKYASMRDLDATMRTYRRMREEHILVNATTFQHLMQVLANFRKTSTAWAILTKSMPSAGLAPTATHYRVAMAGFSNQDEPDKAIMAHRHMLENNVRQSLETKEALVYAEGLLEKKTYNHARSAGEPIPELLKAALDGLHNTIIGIHPRDIANAGRYSAQDLFAPVMWLLGGEKHLATVRQLFEESKAVAERQGQSPWPSMRLSTGLMNATYHARAYSEVEEYWKLVKLQADAIATPFTIPDFVALREQSLGPSAPPQAKHHNEASYPTDDRAEVGFVTSQRPAVQQPQSAPTSGVTTLAGPRPAQARRHILSKSFRIYLASLAAQNRVEDALKEATRLLTQGYIFDNITWNRLIEYIAGSDPPLTLLAFTLTERYLIQNFPGWDGRASHGFRPRKSAIRFNLQYIRARYLGRTELMPQYRTFVWLAKALLELRRREAMGWKGDAQGNELAPDIERFLGTINQIRENAPKTLRAVDLMPRIEDKWQNRLLRDIGWKFPPPSSQERVIADATLLEASDVVDTTLRGNGFGDDSESSSADAALGVAARDFTAHEELDAMDEDGNGPMLGDIAESAGDGDGTDGQTTEPT